MNYPDELLQKMHAASTQSTGQIMGAGVLSQGEAIKQMPQRDKPPVEVSAQRLFERLGQLQAEVDLLTDRLHPVSRPEMKSAGDASARAPSECTLVDMLEQAADRVEHAINRLGSARNRLCI